MPCGARWLLRSVLLVASALLVFACTRGDVAEPGIQSPRPSKTPAWRPPDPTGPLADLEWPAGTIPTDVLLHDDGSALEAVELSGERSVLWRHPEAEVAYIAASPDGRELAVSVSLLPRREKDESFVLYLLDRDGSVKTLDVVSGFRSLDSPIFLRTPTAPKKAYHLHWLRTGEEFDDQGRLDTDLMIYTGEQVLPVTVPLRYNEAVFDLHGYPGAATFTFSLFRQNNVPTRLEILKNIDYAQSIPDASLTLWGDNESRANTDVFVGVAWPSPSEYVIPVAKTSFFEAYSLRLYRNNCEYLGSHVLYEGEEIDIGYSEAPWRILPGGADQILLLGAKDMRLVRNGKRDDAPWLSMRIPDGKIHRTAARWEPGPWAWVSRDLKVGPRDQPRCSGLKWTWP